MKKDIARREFIKLKLDGCSYAACQKKLFQRHNFTASISTLKRWRCNCDRPHRSLNGLTPHQMYFGWKRHKRYILK